MKFYSELSRVYDIVFPMDKVTLSFLKKDITQKSIVLDLACGTGTYSIPLSLEGHEVYGLDLSERMIEAANEKEKGEGTEFIVGDMTKFNEILPGKTFDLAYCIGNSVVHLESYEAVREFIENIYCSLVDGGVLVIQIVNYDRIIKYDISSLPTIERNESGVKFIRKYNYRAKENIVNFDTELVITKEGNEQVYHNSVPLLALRVKELEDMLIKAGFNDICFYGGFDEVPYSEQSFATIVRAKK